MKIAKVEYHHKGKTLSVFLRGKDYFAEGAGLKIKMDPVKIKEALLEVKKTGRTVILQQAPAPEAPKAAPAPEAPKAAPGP